MLTSAKLKPFSPQDFAMLGRTEMAYVKRVATDAGAGYAVHAADGTYLGPCASRDLAFAALRQRDIEPLSVH